MIFNKTKIYTIKNYSKKQINLLPDEINKVKRNNLMSIMLVILLVVIVALFGYYEYTIIKETKELQDEIQISNTIFVSKSQIVENQNIILSLSDRITLKEELLNYIFSTNRSIINILQTFESSSNNVIFINSLSANSTNSFIISGKSLTTEGISALVNKLKKLKTITGEKYFSNVMISGITRVVIGVKNESVEYQFQMTCEFEGGIDNEIE